MKGRSKNAQHPNKQVTIPKKSASKMPPMKNAAPKKS